MAKMYNLTRINSVYDYDPDCAHLVHFEFVRQVVCSFENLNLTPWQAAAAGMQRKKATKQSYVDGAVVKKVR